MPKRIQRKRSRGFRLQDASSNPNGVVYVGRPTKWGNPFVLGDFVLKGDADPSYRGPFKMTYVITTKKHADDRFTELKTVEQVLEWYRWYMGVVTRPLFLLRGKDLACWCPLESPCHADILLELANQ